MYSKSAQTVSELRPNNRTPSVASDVTSNFPNMQNESTKHPTYLEELRLDWNVKAQAARHAAAHANRIRLDTVANINSAIKMRDHGLKLGMTGIFPKTPLKKLAKLRKTIPQTMALKQKKTKGKCLW